VTSAKGREGEARRVVVEHVDGAEARGGILHPGAGRVGIGKVDGVAVDVVALFRQLPRRGLGSPRHHVAADDACALLREQLLRRRPLPASRTRDQDPLAGEPFPRTQGRSHGASFLGTCTDE
jgi:hypothetical protein